MTDRVDWIEHKGRKIMFFNLKGGKHYDILSMVEKGKRLYTVEPLHSILELIDATDADFDSESWKEVRNFAKSIKEYVKAAAIVGTSGMTKFMLKAANIFAKRNVTPFEDLEAAKDWLLEQADASGSQEVGTE
jgi:hypothetical protein